MRWGRRDRPAHPPTGSWPLTLVGPGAWVSRGPRLTRVVGKTYRDIYGGSCRRVSLVGMGDPTPDIPPPSC